MFDHTETREITTVTNPQELIKNKFFTRSILQAFKLNIDLSDEININTVIGDLNYLHDIDTDKETFNEAVEIIRIINEVSEEIN